eukprot:scaffold1446_cov145-Skeletonema_menzelii.AAC.1
MAKFPKPASCRFGCIVFQIIFWPAVLKAESPQEEKNPPPPQPQSKYSSSNYDVVPTRCSLPAR